MTIYFKIWLPWLNLIKLNISYIDRKFRRVIVITVKTLGTKYYKKQEKINIILFLSTVLKKLFSCHILQWQQKRISSKLFHTILL